MCYWPAVLFVVCSPCWLCERDYTTNFQFRWSRDPAGITLPRFWITRLEIFHVIMNLIFSGVAWDFEGVLLTQRHQSRENIVRKMRQSSRFYDKKKCFFRKYCFFHISSVYARAWMRVWTLRSRYLLRLINVPRSRQIEPSRQTRPIRLV